MNHKTTEMLAAVNKTLSLSLSSVGNDRERTHRLSHELLISRGVAGPSVGRSHCIDMFSSQYCYLM